MSSIPQVLSTIAIRDYSPDTGKDEGILSKTSKFFKDLKNSMEDKNKAFNVFEKNFLFLKSFVILFLVILAIVNYLTYKNTGLITKKPLMFFLESILFGLSGVIPFLMICFFRNNNHFSTKEIMNISIALFLLFFVLNYVLELDGIYSVLFNKEDNKQENKNPDCENNEDSERLKNSLGKTSDIFIIFIIVVSLFSLFYATAFVRDYNPKYHSFNSVSPYIVFLVEMILFGVISASPIFFMAYNRDVLSSHTTKEFLLVVIKFSILHFLLQVSGFYSYIFTGNVQ